MSEPKSLELIYQEYLRKTASLKISANYFDKMFKDGWKKLAEQNQNRIEFGYDDFFGMQNFLFFTVDNKPVSYDLKNYSFEDSRNNLIDSWNRMYQLLLVQAFEAFSEFVKDLYSLLLDLGFELPRPCRRGEQLPCEKSFKFNVATIRQKLFKLYSTLEVYDTRNQLKINFKFMLPFIEKLRHSIAHSHGEFKDIEEFKREVLEVNGLFNNGKYDPELDRNFNSFTRTRNGILEIAMMPLPQASDGVFDEWINRFDELNDVLMAYAELLQRIFKQKMDKL